MCERTSSPVCDAGSWVFIYVAHFHVQSTTQSTLTQQPTQRQKPTTQKGQTEYSTCQNTPVMKPMDGTDV